jgi:hypothetical protein
MAGAASVRHGFLLEWRGDPGHSTGPASGRMVTSHTGRDGRPIEREFEIIDDW